MILSLIAFLEHINPSQSTLAFNVDAVIHNLTEYRNTNNDTKADQLISDIEALSKLANETDAQAVSMEYLSMDTLIYLFLYTEITS